MKTKRKEISSRQIVLMAISILLFVLLLVVRVTDETKDDLSIQLYISDCDGPPNYYHMWASPFRIMAMYVLQRLVPMFAWNYLFQVIIIFVSILIICNIIMKRFSGRFGELIAVFFAVLLFFQTVSTLNFTRTSVLTMCAGSCLFFEDSKKMRVLGGLWFIAGTIIRFNAMYISVGFLGIMCFSALLRQNGKIKVKIRNVISLYVLPILCLLCIVVGVRCLGKCIINSDQQWRHLFDKNVLSERLLDYELHSYDEAYEKYQEWEITENDCRMIETRMSNSDDNYFTMDLYHVFIEHFSEKWEFDLSRETLQEWISEIKGYFVNSCFGMFVLVSLFIGFLYSNRKDRGIIVGICFCMIAYLLLFCMMGRVVDRVSFGVYLWAGIAMLNSCSFGVYPKIESEYWKRFLLLGGILFVSIFTISMGIKHQRKTDETIAELYDYMGQDTGHFYFYKGFSEYRAIENLLLMRDYWNTGNSFYSSNYDICPNERIKLEEYGIQNIYKDAVNSEVIRFINCSDMDIIETYIREHYCSSARAVLIDEVAEYQVYRIVSS